jgi:hypothetical protein
MVSVFVREVVKKIEGGGGTRAWMTIPYASRVFLRSSGKERTYVPVTSS